MLYTCRTTEDLNKMCPVFQKSDKLLDDGDSSRYTQTIPLL